MDEKYGLAKNLSRLILLGSVKGQFTLQYFAQNI